MKRLVAAIHRIVCLGLKKHNHNDKSAGQVKRTIIIIKVMGRSKEQMSIYLFVMVVTFLFCSNILVGRKVIEVRVCACPGRDRTREEAKSS